MKIRGKEDMAEIVRKYGFLPFFSSAIPGFSVEEMAAPEVWFPPKGEGVWEWKDDVIAATGGTYGRFFHSRPAFISKDFFTLLAAYRRDGYDYEGFSNDGHATHSERVVYEKLSESESEISSYLRQTISTYDTQENFYHAFLAGLLSGAGYVVRSNRESGEGRPDIILLDRKAGAAAIFELKRAENLEGMKTSAEEAISQLKAREYGNDLVDYDRIIGFGISFYRKRALVMASGKRPAGQA